MLNNFDFEQEIYDSRAPTSKFRIYNLNFWLLLQYPNPNIKPKLKIEEHTSVY